MNCIRLCRLIERKSYIGFNLQSARNVSHHPIRFMETQNMWREKDGVSKRWQLIYKAPMNTALNVVSTYLTFTTGVIGAGGIYYGAYVYDPADFNKPVVINNDVVIANSPTECLLYIGAFVALHIAIKMILAKYVLRMYKDGDEYIAIYRGHFFNSIIKHKFNLKDFRKLNPIVIIPWSESRYGLGSKQGILLENYFKTPEYFNDLLLKKSKEDEDT